MLCRRHAIYSARAAAADACRLMPITRLPRYIRAIFDGRY